MGMSIAVNLGSAGLQAMPAASPRLRPSNTGFKTKIKEKRFFDSQAFFCSTSKAGKVVEYQNNVTVFTQGDPAMSVLYIREGSVEITIVNAVGKEAVVAILGPGNFFGEGCLAGQTQRVSTAATITRSTILVIEKPEMVRLLHADSAFSEQFIKHMLLRNIRSEEDLVDHLLNSTEKRLARTLLSLAHYGEPEKVDTMVPELSQEILAEMIGTTRSRVNFFMNKFRKLHFIEYGGRMRGLQINKSLVSVVQND